MFKFGTIPTALLVLVSLPLTLARDCTLEGNAVEFTLKLVIPGVKQFTWYATDMCTTEEIPSAQDENFLGTDVFWVASCTSNNKFLYADTHCSPVAL